MFVNKKYRWLSPVQCSVLLVLVGISIWFVPLRTSYAATQQQAVQPFRYFEETGHNIAGPFLAFYEANGDLPIFGLPLTEAITETRTVSDTEQALLVQYFERARFEMQLTSTITATSNAVRISSLGTSITRNRRGIAFEDNKTVQLISDTLPFPLSDMRFFTETGHSLRGEFGSFWHKHGGADVFGYPISEPMIETIDEQRYVVQYFQNARLEYSASNGNTANRVHIGLLGREYLSARPALAEMTKPVPPLAMLATASTPYYGEDSPDGHNILLAAQRLDGRVVLPAQELSFLEAMGPINAEAGFTQGLGIVAHEIVPVIGGGICQVSSALYEAAFSAGLDMRERHNHSYLLQFFAHQPGLEAAVYVDTWVRQDLRWRNDTPHPIYVVAQPDHAATVVRVSLWAVPNERQVTLSAPDILATYEPEEVWIFDEEVAEGEFEQEQAGVPGMDVGIWRQVLDAEGNVLHENWVTTSYAPISPIFRYGRCGNPNAEEEDEECTQEDEECAPDDEACVPDDDAESMLGETYIPPQPEQPAKPAPQPEQPAEPAPQPEQPAEPAPQPEQPAEPAPQPEQPAEPAPQPEQPAEPAPQPEPAPPPDALDPPLAPSGE